MAGSLRTTPQAIASVGMTVDGRELTEQDINEIVETYNYERYGARINVDHNANWSGWAAQTLQNIKLSGGMLGDVMEVSKGTNDEGVTCLYAILCPNKSMLQLNQEDQYVYYSIEIEPIDQTGKMYLTGLAMTDYPACTYTTRAKFSSKLNPNYKQQQNQQVPRFAMQLEQEQSFFNNLTNKFKGKGNEMDETKVKQAIAKELNQFAKDFSNQVTESVTSIVEPLTQSLNQLEQKFSKKFSTENKNEAEQENQNNKGENSNEGENNNESEEKTELSTQINQLTEQIGTMQQAFKTQVDELQTKFNNALVNPGDHVTNPEGESPGDKGKYHKVY